MNFEQWLFHLGFEPSPAEWDPRRATRPDWFRYWYPGVRAYGEHAPFILVVTNPAMVMVVWSPGGGAHEQAENFPVGDPGARTMIERALVKYDELVGGSFGGYA